MDRTLGYASANLTRRFSRNAWIALGVALLGPIISVAIAALLSTTPMGGGNMLIAFLLLLFGPPIVAFALGTSAIVRISSSAGRFRGICPAILGVVASIGWPVFAIFWTVQHLPNC